MANIANLSKMIIRITDSGCQMLKRQLLVSVAAIMFAAADGQTQVSDGTLRIPRTFKDETVLPSPEAAQMNRYKDCPVSYNTGTVRTDISLYEIKSGSLSFPISLSYHSSGIKVDDENCTVGLGWSLVAGGNISRTVHGRPDEQSALCIKECAGIVRNGDMTYLKNVLHRRIDANYDRYNYSFDNYSGSFIIQDGSIVQLPQTDLKIELTGTEDEGVRDFLITAPDGKRYLFSEREHSKYKYAPMEAQCITDYRTTDYTAVTGWMLTEIISSSCTDTISISYKSTWQSRTDFPDHIKSRSFVSTDGAGYEMERQSPGLSSTATSEFPDKRIPSVVKSRTCTVTFTSGKTSGSDYSSISEMTVTSSSGREVRDINFAYSAFSDGRVCLNGVTVKSDGILIDSHNFTYYPETGVRQKDSLGYNNHKDFFGFSNYLSEGAETANNSVLNDDGTLGSNRAFCFESAEGCALKSVTEAAGVTVTYEYEPNECAGFRHTVDIGLRIKCIRVKDPVTGRQRIRMFGYENAACTIDFDRLDVSSFISAGGLTGLSSTIVSSGVITDEVQMNNSLAYTTGASFTSSCRVPGFSAEDAVIYYGKVTETVSGTGLDEPQKTVYEYDVSDIRHPYIGNGGRTLPSIDESALSGSDAGRYIGTKVSCTNNPSMTDVYSRIFGPHYLYGHFRETVWDKAPLVRKTTYRYADNGYEPAEEEINSYSVDKEAPMDIGFYVENITRNVRSAVSAEVKEVLEKVSDLNFYETTLQSGRLFKDSTKVIKYFHDGSSRAVLTAYSYNGRSACPIAAGYRLPLDSVHFVNDSIAGGGTTIHGIFRGDSIAESTLPLLLSVKVTCGDRTFNRYYCYSSNIYSSFYNNVRGKGIKDLPVMEMTVADGNDTLLVTDEYGYYGNGDNLQQSRRRLLHNGTEISSQDFHDYDGKGSLLYTTVNRGASTSYLWEYPSSLISATVRGGRAGTILDISEPISADTLMTTRYSYEPLVGCTSVTRPNRRMSQYSYTGGRLSAVKNSSGEMTAGYTYSLAGESSAGGLNRISGSVYTAPSCASAVTTETYYDGTGLPVNTVRKGFTPSGGDLAAMTVYDAADRRTEEWLPVPMQNVSSPIGEDAFASAALTFYEDRQPYESYVYELSPEGNLLETLPVGEVFCSHPVTADETCSDPSVQNLRCRRFTPDGSYGFAADGYYGTGELDVVKNTDGDGRVTYTFTDYRGTKILERRAASGTSGGYADTYYVSDALGNLRFVLPPSLGGMEGEGCGPWDIRSDEALRGNAYFYLYDRKMNIAEKKIPGAEPVRYIYDRTGNAVFSQDGNRRTSGRWHFTLGDRFGRVTVEGLCGRPDSAMTARTWVHTGSPDYGSPAATLCGSGYTADMTIPSPELLAADYYDGSGFMALPGFAGHFGSEHSSAPSGLYQTDSRGLLTGTMRATLPSGGYVYAVNSYDCEDRLTGVRSADTSGNADTEETEYSFDGRPVRRTHTHGRDGSPESAVTEVYTYTYDNAGRPLKTAYSLNGAAPVTLADDTYDDTGRLTTDGRNGNPNLTTGYTYNIRSWTSKIESPLFTENLYYGESHNGSTAQYGGDVSAADWKSGTSAARTHGYVFDYDGLSRLTKAVYTENGNRSGRYDTEYGYDIAGNILSLKRSGLQDDGAYGLIDDLTYTYSGGQVTKIDDGTEGPYYNEAMHFADGADETAEYSYDGNGNMTKDLNKNILSIQYNSLNLPMKTTFGDGSHVDYIYDAGGMRLRTEYCISPTAVMLLQGDSAMVIIGDDVVAPDDTACMETYAVMDVDSLGFEHTRIEYCGNFIYEDGTLKQILIDGGYVTFFDGDVSRPKYHFYIKDHLGNDRIVADADGSVEERDDYYPFGALMGDSRNTETQRFKYNGKELDRMHGLDWYDYGARNYDAATCRFTTIDPLAEKYYDVNPYVYCMGNPINFIDPDGKKVRMYVETQGVGHTFITTGEGNKMTVYTYGRYLGGDKEKLSSNSLDPVGRGVLVKLTGSDAKAYINKEKKTFNVKSFIIRDANEKKVMSYYEKMYNSSRKLTRQESKAYDSNPHRNGHSYNARVVDKYNLLLNNCTTKSIEGVRYGGTKLNFIISTKTSPTDIQMYNDITPIIAPAQLKFYLETYKIKK